MNSEQRSRTAFTLIELLVVIAVIAILIALLVPAVQKVREASNRTHCQNNLKQIALAVHNYHSTFSQFPRNGSRFNKTTSGTGTMTTSWSFLARMLPYLEKDDIYKLGDIDNASINGNPVTSMTLKIFLCPSDDSVNMSPSSKLCNPGITGTPVGCTNYKGVSGPNWCWSANPAWNNVGPGGSCDLFYVNSKGKGDGMFFRTDILYKLQVKHITDGTSNTFMVGEDIPSRSAWSTWMYANGSSGTCAIPPNTPGTPAAGDVEDSTWTENFGFRSKHPGGLQFALADGSVRFIDQAIDIAQYRALSTIAGEENRAMPD